MKVPPKCCFENESTLMTIFFIQNGDCEKNCCHFLCENIRVWVKNDYFFHLKMKNEHESWFSQYNQKFSTLQIIHTGSERLLGSNEVSFTSDGSNSTFRVMFKEPIEITSNANYTASATLKVNKETFSYNNIKVHSFLKHCFAWPSVVSIWWYFQLILQLNSADISWKYHQIE